MVRYTAIGLVAVLCIVPDLLAKSCVPRPGSAASVANMKDKIKNVVVLIFENRSFDNILGGQTYPGLDNSIQKGPFCNPVNMTDPSAGQVCTHPRTYDEIANDLDHAVFGNTFEFYGTFHPDEEAIQNGTTKATMNGFAAEQIRLWNSFGFTNNTLLGEQAMYYYPENLT